MNLYADQNTVVHITHDGPLRVYSPYLYEHGRVNLFPSIAAVVQWWKNYRDSNGIRASQIPGVYIHNEIGRQLAYVSYNGRLWTLDGRPATGG